MGKGYDTGRFKYYKMSYSLRVCYVEKLEGKETHYHPFPFPWRYYARIHYKINTYMGMGMKTLYPV